METKKHVKLNKLYIFVYIYILLLFIYIIYIILYFIKYIIYIQGVCVCVCVCHTHTHTHTLQATRIFWTFKTKKQMEVQGEPVILLQYYNMWLSICFSIMWKCFLCACGLFVGEVFFNTTGFWGWYYCSENAWGKAVTFTFKHKQHFFPAYFGYI